MAPLLLEREEILEELERACELAVGGAGCAILIEGAPGIGKTSLLSATSANLPGLGIRSLLARGSELERHPWSLARELLEPALRDRPEGEVFAGAATLARPVLRGEAADASTGPEASAAATLHGLYWVVATLTEREPLALLVDDVHWADSPSLRFLLYLAQRSADLPLAIVLAARPGEPGAERELLDRLGAAASGTLRPAELSADAVAALSAQILGGDPDPEFARACHALTGGNPFLLGELLRALRAEGAAPDSAAIERVNAVGTDSIARSVLLRIAALPAEARRLAAALSVLETSTIERASQVTAIPLDDAAALADRLVELDVLARELPLRFAHPLVRTAVYEALAPAERARLHAAAAAELRSKDAPVTELATHLAATEPRGDGETVDVLRQAASDGLAQGAPELAADWLARALQEPPPDADRVDVLVELAEAEAIAGRPEAIGRLDDALAATAEAADRARIGLRLGWMLCRSGRLVEGCDVLGRALDDARDTDPALAEEVEAAYLANAWQTADHAGEVRRRQRQLVASRTARTSRPLLAQSALARLFAGEDREELIGDCLRLLESGVLADETADSLNFWIAVGCLSWSDALVESERAIAAAFEDAHRRHSPVATAWAYYARSWPNLWRGRVSDAAADAEAAVEAWSGGWGMYLPAAKYWLCVALIERDDLDGAEAAIDLAGEERWVATSMHVLWTLGRAALAAARGDHERAVECAFEAGSLATETFRIENPSVFPWRSAAALSLARLGRRDEATDLAAAECDLARGFGAPRALGVALRARGIAEGGAAGVGHLEESISVLEAAPARLDLAHSLVALGSALARQGERRAARAHLSAGLDLAARCGSLALVRRAEEELHRVGARPRRRMLTGPEALTPAERRVCELATAGNTNREIAEELFVSLRTVETHLTHAYGKLGISSRAELAAALERDSVR